MSGWVFGTKTSPKEQGNKEVSLGFRWRNTYM